MRLIYVWTAATSLLTTVSSFPHLHIGRRQLLDDSDAKELATSTGSSSQNAYSLTENAPPPFATLSSLLLGYKPPISYLTTGTGQLGSITSGVTGTGTGIGSSPTSTGAPVPYPYQNVTSAFPPGSTGGISNSISGYPVLSLPTGTRPHLGHGPVSLPSGFPKKVPSTHTLIENSRGDVGYSATGVSGYGSVPPESGSTSSIVAHNLIGLPLTTDTAAAGSSSSPTSSSSGASESANIPFPTTIRLSPSGTSEIARESAPTSSYPGGLGQGATAGGSGSACVPIVTVTQSSVLTITVTAGSGVPISGAPFTSAPYSVWGNGTSNGYPTGAAGTGTGLPSGTATKGKITPVPLATASLQAYT